MFTDHFFQKRVQPPQDPLYTYIRTHIQTDGDYIKRVVHGPPGNHTLKKVTEIRVSKIRVSEIRVNKIRVTEIRISSNHRELHGAIFFLGLTCAVVANKSHNSRCVSSNVCSAKDIFVRTISEQMRTFRATEESSKQEWNVPFIVQQLDHFTLLFVLHKNRKMSFVDLCSTNNTNSSQHEWQRLAENWVWKLSERVQQPKGERKWRRPFEQIRTKQQAEESLFHTMQIQKEQYTFEDTPCFCEFLQQKFDPYPALPWKQSHSETCSQGDFSSARPLVLLNCFDLIPCLLHEKGVQCNHTEGDIFMAGLWNRVPSLWDYVTRMWLILKGMDRWTTYPELVTFHKETSLGQPQMCLHKI